LKKYIIGFWVGVIFATTGFALASQPIKLIVNGKEIQCDVPPQVINDRTMVPARFLAEALGAKVSWDENQNAVVVTSDYVIGGTPSDLGASSNNVLNTNNQKVVKNKILKVNGIPTDLKWLEKDNDLYVHSGVIAQFINSKYKGQNMWFSEKEFKLGDNIYPRRSMMNEEDLMLFSLNQMKELGFLNYSWDPTNVELILN